MDKAYDRAPTVRSRELRNSPTDAERALWQHLRNRQLAGARFNRQVTIGPYVCDFVSRASKLIIELDGGHHAVNIRADQKRTTFLEQQGYCVLRFWNNEVLENVEGVIGVIEGALTNRPSPTPPASGRGFS